LSATPNGKNHGCDKLSSQKTLRAGSHTQPLGPRTVSRLGHTTRFFTIVHQQAPPAVK